MNAIPATVRIRFTSANPYITYTSKHHLYLVFPLGLYAFTKLVLRLGVDGVVTSTAQATSLKHKNPSSPIIRNSAAILIKYFTLYFTIHIGSITHTSPIYPRSLHFAAHITGLVRLIYQYGRDELRLPSKIRWKYFTGRAYLSQPGCNCGWIDVGEGYWQLLELKTIPTLRLFK